MHYIQPISPAAWGLHWYFWHGVTYTFSWEILFGVFVILAGIQYLSPMVYMQVQYHIIEIITNVGFVTAWIPCPQ